jgi:hypothetical protein
VVDELKKAQVIFDHYDTIQGNYVNWSMALHFGWLNIPTPDMVGMDHCFSEDDVWGWSEQMHQDKAQTEWVHRVVLPNDLAYHVRLSFIAVSRLSQFLPCQSSIPNLAMEEARRTNSSRLSTN